MQIYFYIFFSCVLIVLTGICVFLWIVNRNTSKRYNTLKSEFGALEQKLHLAELEGLQYKMNPHLFKNVLNSIQSHAYQTYYALDKLSNVLDYILYESNKKMVSVKDELEFALNLIEINKVKLSPLFDLQVKNKINDEEPFYNQELMAPMVTADLIENAFKHVDTQSGDSFISITFELKDNQFRLTVANKISGRSAMKKPNGGFGTENIKRRLDIIYKDCYDLERFVEKDVFISHLKIDLLEYKGKVLAAG